ncbi:MAG TPA: transglycosylase SLT domain-containing protein [Burkholderiaceae bacterium]|nr:transglycosylase SLT domain-containing protein [Burkholderiaceae bacterium]
MPFYPQFGQAKTSSCSGHFTFWTPVKISIVTRLLTVIALALPAAHASSQTAFSDIDNKPNQASASTNAEPEATDAAVPAKVEEPIAVLAPTTDADLWARIRRGFGMNGLDQTELISHHEQWYSSRPDYINRMTSRSSKYLYHVVEELERRKMPTELALLPFIESAFNPQAVSGAKAAGMWQFMPATGRYFSLKQSVFKDDRRDVLASTRAALDYLQKLYGMFGDWHLALAAYNWGEGSVGRAIARNQREGLGTDYYSLSMPNETRHYVPKLLAVKNIVANPAAYNSTLPDIPNHPYFQSVAIDRDMDVALAAKLAEVDLDDFKSLNPSANKPVIFKAGTPYILLPWDNAGIFERNLAIHNGQTAGWTVWTAPSLLTVADAARRVGMNEARFREINRIPPRMLIKAGSSLLVPRSAKHTTDVPLQIADNGQISFSPEIILKKMLIKLKKAGTVVAIAKQYKVSASNLANWNKVNITGNFKAMQTIVLYVPAKGKAGKSTRSKGSTAKQSRTKSASASKPARKRR